MVTVITEKLQNQSLEDVKTESLHTVSAHTYNIDRFLFVCLMFSSAYSRTTSTGPPLANDTWNTREFLGLSLENYMIPGEVSAVSATFTKG